MCLERLSCLWQGAHEQLRRGDCLRGLEGVRRNYDAIMSEKYWVSLSGLHQVTKTYTTNSHFLTAMWLALASLGHCLKYLGPKEEIFGITNKFTLMYIYQLFQVCLLISQTKLTSFMACVLLVFLFLVRFFLFLFLFFVVAVVLNFFF